MSNATGQPGLHASTVLEGVFRVGVAACFIGHGAFGLIGKEAWLPYFAVVGIPESWAWSLMPWVGGLDILLGVLTLFAPLPIVLAYMVGWASWTALLRPLAGESAFETLERAGNYGLPLAFLLATRFRFRSAGWRDWIARVGVDVADANQRARVVRVLQGTTALLLVGHGGLAASGKPLLTQHLAVVTGRTDSLALFGAFEVALGVGIWFSLNPILLAGVLAWKVGTEALFPLSGASGWEFVERGGSYAAPAALLVLTGARDWLAARLPRNLVAREYAAPVFALGALGAAIGFVGSTVVSAVPEGATPTTPIAAAHATGVRERLRAGGLILACRHALTDRSRGDARRVDLDDPSTQRVLSAAGRDQAVRLGQALRSLEVPIADVHASPYARTVDTAELAFGRVERTRALQYGNSGAQRRGREALLSRAPVGGNRVLVSHQGILYGMFPSVQRGSIREGDCVVVTPGSRDEREVLGRYGPVDFAALAADGTPGGTAAAGDAS